MVNNHVKSVKHTDRKEKVKTKEKKERDITAALMVYNKETHQERGVPSSRSTYIQGESCHIIPKSWYTNEKVSCFRPILVESGHRLTDKSHMANLILFEDKLWLKQELGNRNVSIIFDGTTRLGEAYVL